jgi:hypothetical protein
MNATKIQRSAAKAIEEDYFSRKVCLILFGKSQRPYVYDMSQATILNKYPYHWDRTIYMGPFGGEVIHPVTVPDTMDKIKASKLIIRMASME